MHRASKWSCTCNHHPDQGLGHFQENLLVLLPSQYHPLHPCPQITTVLTSVTTHLFYLFLNFNLAQLCNILFCVCLPSPNIVSETRLNTRAFQSKATWEQNEKYAIYLSKTSDGRVLEHDKLLHSSCFYKGYHFHFLYLEHVNNISFPLLDFWESSSTFPQFFEVALKPC